MKRYKVTVSYRPNANRLERHTASFNITARNKQAALIEAGWLMHMNEMHHVQESLTVEIVAL